MRLRASRKRHKKLPPKIVGDSKVKVGFPQSKTSQDIVDIAIFNHYGTETIPERPFLSNAISANNARYRRIMRDQAAGVMSGANAIGDVMTKLGLLAQGHVQQEIVDLRDPPNAPSTIKQKKSSNPLIDTGEMRQSVTFETYD